MWIDGFRLAVTTFTVFPAGQTSLDRRSAAWAMRFAPTVGAVLGAIAGGAAWLIGGWLGGIVATALLAILSRGMHLDGLADTVDGLGSYKSREQALAIMKSPDVGAFGVAAIVFSVLIQSAGFAAVSFPGAVCAVMTGRLAATIGCRRGVAAAASSGLGAFFSGTVGAFAIIVNILLIGLIAAFAVPHRIWQGPVAVLAAVGVVFALLAHTNRRLGGITGDVLGFGIEAATVTVLIGLSLH